MKHYVTNCFLMGNQFQIGLVTDDDLLAEAASAAAIREIQRIEELLSTYRDSSETTLVNAYAGIKPVEVSTEFLALVERCMVISKLTQGAFDITYGGLDTSLWNFDNTMVSLPDRAVAASAVKLINYELIQINKQASTIYLPKTGMRIGFGGIGKGYAAAMAQQVVQEMGIPSGLINASGDIATWGANEHGKAWTIGIVNPNFKQSIFSTLQIANRAIATSGNYEKFVVIEGKKYSHTIDPKTGYPIQGIKSVTTICPQAEFADAMTTPIMILGVDKGLHLVNQINGLECIVIDDNDRIFHSKGISIYA